LRLLYVALTRAQCQVVCWWSPTKNTIASPLHRMLMRTADGTDDDAGEVPSEPAVPADDDVVAVFARWRDRGGPAPEPARPAELAGPGPAAEVQALGVRSFTRTVDAAWRRTSYSSLSAARAETVTDAVSSEPEVVGKDDEELSLVEDGRRIPTRDQATEVRSPMAELPVGATFGSLVHAVLEHVDPEADDLRAEVLAHIDEQRGWWPVDLDREVLADALVAVCDSPLGGPGSLLSGVTLRGVPLTDRLREMDFEIPLVGGDVRGPGADVRLGDLGPLLERHLPIGDPVRAYADALGGPLGDQPLRGYLTGSVDVVLRVPTPGGPRFHVVDYKTNWLGPVDEPLTAAAYRPEALDAAMGHSDYPLQALLYATVLHRFLRWRLPGYDPEVHLGEVLYLYVRGMCGPDTPIVGGIPCGVFTWQAPVPLVHDLSDLLAGRVAMP
jgi:exodeoxyribonuclease V beta subunit